MKYKNFLLRAVNLLLILGILWQYQQVALVRAAAVSQRKQEIAEVEAYNASVLQAQSAAQAEQTQSGYRDGIYEGSAFGFWRCHPGVGDHPERKNDRYCGAGCLRRG